MRRAIARRTVQSKQTVPHFYLTMPVEMDGALAFLASINSEVAPGGDKITINDLIVRACSQGLSAYPDVNASYTSDERLRRNGQVSIGIAVGTEEGLTIPVMANCGSMSLRAISKEARRLIERARAGQLQPPEMAGGSMTVSNLGMFGIEEFGAIINPPESVILAVGAITPEAVVVADGSIASRRRMRMTLSCDHRVVDGVLGARFLQEIRRLLEHPFELVS
jgi:pyruvate dehydrogenase E2 component (dihydrolipoamide acetyltransferase)